jgi:hypothetical protein
MAALFVCAMMAVPLTSRAGERKAVVVFFADSKLDVLDVMFLEVGIGRVEEQADPGVMVRARVGTQSAWRRRAVAAASTVPDAGSTTTP